MGSGVEFDEDSFSYSKPNPNNSAPSGYTPTSQMSQYSSQNNVRGMAGWLMRHGLAKSANGAQYILVAVIIVNIIITFMVIAFLL